MTARGDRRVRSGAGALAYLALIWTIINFIPTTLFGITANYVANPPDGADPGQVRIGWLALAGFATVAAAGWYAAWRQASRGCWLTPGGLRVRGWVQMRDVPFADVVDVSDTQFQTDRRAPLAQSQLSRNAFEFARTKVSYAEPGGRTREVAVSAHFRANQRDKFRILTWLPPEHPLRIMLPAELRTTGEVPSAAPGVVRPDAPVTTQLRPGRSVLAVSVGLLLILIAACGVGLAVCLSSHAGGRFIGAALLAVSLVVLVRAALDVCRSRVDSRRTDSSSTRCCARKRIPVGNITGFAVALRGFGGQVMVRQLVGADHTSLVCTRYGSRPVEVELALQHWLMQLTAHQLRWAQNVEGQEL